MYKEVAYVIITLVLFFSYFIPMKCGYKNVGILWSTILSILFLMAYFKFDDVADIGLVFYFIIILLGISFIVYWVFRYYNQGKKGLIISFLLPPTFLLFMLNFKASFEKEEISKILENHEMKLTEEIILVSSQKEGYYEFYNYFEIQLGTIDFEKMKNKFISGADRREQPKFLNKSFTSLKYDEDSDNYRMMYQFEGKKKMGIVYFDFLLSKSDKTLTYVESNE